MTDFIPHRKEGKETEEVIRAKTIGGVETKNDIMTLPLPDWPERPAGIACSGSRSPLRTSVMSLSLLIYKNTGLRPAASMDLSRPVPVCDFEMKIHSLSQISLQKGGQHEVEREDFFNRMAVSLPIPSHLTCHWGTPHCCITMPAQDMMHTGNITHVRQNTIFVTDSRSLTLL